MAAVPWTSQYGRCEWPHCTREATNIDNPMKALKAAEGGTLCIWQGPQLAKIVTAIPQPRLCAQLMVGAPPHRMDVLLKSPIVLPPLRRRDPALDRIIDAFLVEARADLGGTFLPSDRAWIRQHDAKTLARIEFATRRLVALRGAGGSITRTARILGVAHSALSEWPKNSRAERHRLAIARLAAAVERLHRIEVVECVD